MDKTSFAQLIDAYADAKVTDNKILIKVMIGELEVALNQLFPDVPQALPTPSEVQITPEA